LTIYRELDNNIISVIDNNAFHNLPELESLWVLLFNTGFSGGIRVANVLVFCVVLLNLGTFPHINDLQFVVYSQLFVGGPMSYLRYLCLF